MRNPSKNTIKRIMINAKHNHDKYSMYFHHKDQDNAKYSIDLSDAYFLFNEVGARVYIMSKGKICNRLLKGLKKYQ